MKLRFFLLSLLSLFCIEFAVAQTPVRIGIDGLTHDHIHGLLRDHQLRTDIEIVGIAEPNKALVEKYSKQYGFDPQIAYDNLESMVKATKPQGVVAFNSIYEHLSTVEICAPLGIHVMVEKPLAVNEEHASRMAELAKRHNIHLLTNYETSWYPTNYEAYKIAVTEQRLGNINKVIICDGHKGPREIGCSEEFLAWLTDPVMNGGGAVVDFGCYGANLMTWLMKNELPLTVTAVLQQIKPNVYPKVDDQATIILAYPHSQAIIQGSWNWPVDRKDMEIYCSSGYVKAFNTTDLSYRLKREVPEVIEKITNFPSSSNEPFNYFANVIKGNIQVEKTDLASLENNLIVVKILDAAKESSKRGMAIQLK